MQPLLLCPPIIQPQPLYIRVGGDGQSPDPDVQSQSPEPERLEDTRSSLKDSLDSVTV
jgi:hypothetical protein